MAKTLDFDCGIAYERIASWLDDELHLPVNAGKWVYGSPGETCEIALSRLEPREFAQLEIERSHLIAQGDAQAVDAFEHLFTLRFISAGG